MRLVVKRLSPLLVLLMLLSSGTSVWAQDQADGRLPSCDLAPFDIVYRYFFSPDFSQDSLVFTVAVGRGGHGWQFYRSTNGGLSWNLNREARVDGVAFSPYYLTDATIFSAEGSHLFRSVDRGATWEQLILPEDGPTLGGIDAPIVAASADTIFYGAANPPGSAAPNTRGLFKIKVGENGVTWEQLTFRNVNSISLSPDFARDQTLFIGEYDYKVNYGLRKSVDGGKTWRNSSVGIDLSAGPTGSSYTVMSFAPGYPDDAVIFAQTASRYYRSDDKGVTWQQVDPLVPRWSDYRYFKPNWIVSPNFARDRTAWIEFGTWLTRDAGETWRQVGATEYMDLTAREWCEGERCGMLLLGGSGWYEPAGVYKSFDLGRTWQCADAPTPAWWPDVPPLVSTWLPVIVR